jgi:hypothetical protein
MPVGQRTIKSMDATTMWTLLSIFVIAPLGAFAFDRPLFGNWIWRIDRENALEPNSRTANSSNDLTNQEVMIKPLNTPITGIDYSFAHQRPRLRR